MRLSESEFSRLPSHLRSLFVKIPNPGSDEVLACFPDAPGQLADESHSAPSAKTSNVYGAMKRQGEASQDRRYTDNGSTNFAATPGARRIDSGSAARFFYCAKSSRREKNKGVPPGPDGKPGNNHPTVKPVALMRWLVRLVTPPGGTVLDPFAGSGTTGVAATLENFNAILMDMDPHNSDITRHRVNAERDLFTQGVE